MNCNSTRNSVQGLQSVILLINDTSSSSFLGEKAHIVSHQFTINSIYFVTS